MRRNTAIWFLVASAVALGVACSGGSGSEKSATSQAIDDVDRRVDTILADGGPSFGEFNRDELRRLITADDDAPFYIVNFIKFRELAAYPDGRDAAITGREANNRYNVLPILLEIGARPVFVSEVEQQLIGSDTTWDQVAIVLYPSRQAFVSMLERTDFQQLSVHKEAAVEKSIVLVTDRKDVPVLPPVDTATLPFPPSAQDAEFTMIHLMQFAERVASTEPGQPDISGRDAIAAYEQSVALSALPLGIRPLAVFEVEGVLIGDGRPWEEVRLNRFPSHAAFRALTADPTWAAHQPGRAAALRDTYALITLPLVDSLATR